MTARRRRGRGRKAASSTPPWRSSVRWRGRRAAGRVSGSDGPADVLVGPAALAPWGGADAVGLGIGGDKKTRKRHVDKEGSSDDLIDKRRRRMSARGG